MLQAFVSAPFQQAVLIRQLQEQHYHQYMQQLLHQQLGGPATNEKGEQCLVPNLANENITYYTNGSRSLPMATSTGTIITNGNIEDGDADGDEEQSLGLLGYNFFCLTVFQKFQHQLAHELDLCSQTFFKLSFKLQQSFFFLFTCLKFTMSFSMFRFSRNIFSFNVDT